MGLESFLSAFKQLILENETLPENTEDRKAYYKNKFPLLNDLEIEDLAKLPPNKLRIYTGTIFRGEVVVLEKRLPLTFSALRQQASKIINLKKFDPFSLLIEAQKKYPWRSNATKDLVQAFIRYVSDILAPQTELLWIADLAKLEGMIAEVKRSPQPHLTSQVNLRAQNELLVQDFLKIRLRIQNEVQVLSSNFDLNEIRDAVANNQTEISPAAEDTAIHYLVSRNAKLFPRVTIISEQEKMLIEKLKQSETSSEIETFIEARLSLPPSDQPLSTAKLEALFAESVQRIITLEKAGALILEAA